MSLICDIEIESGLNLEKAFLNISSFSGTENQLSFVLDIYVDTEAFKNNKMPVASKAYNMSFDHKKNLLNQAYEYLKTFPEYKDAAEA